MTQHNKERHAAAMLVHQLGSDIEALGELSHGLFMENLDELFQQSLALDRLLLHHCEIEEAKNELYRSHQ